MAQEKPSVDKLMSLVKANLGKTNQVILDEMQSPVALIPQLAGHLIAAGGKRLRPVLTLIASQLYAYQGDKHIPLAAVVEFIHTATLLHDDVVDQSDLRRGQATASTIWGNEASVLVGDFLFSRAFQLAVKVGNLEALGVLAKASSILAEGEVMQMLASNTPDLAYKTYLEVIENKTAVLFAAAAQLGPILSKSGTKEIERMRQYGSFLGVAFQLVDDLLDYRADQAALGKEIGDDFREGKITLPVILAWDRGNEVERSFWTRTLEAQKMQDGDLQYAQSLLQKHGCLDDTLGYATDYGDKAKACLESLPTSPQKQGLLDLVDVAIHRGA